MSLKTIEVCDNRREGAFGERDTSGELEQQKYAEKLVLDVDSLKVLNSLKELATEAKDKKGYEYVTATLDDLIPLGYGGKDANENELSLTAAQVKINAVFVALNRAGVVAPFKAATFTSGKRKVPREIIEGDDAGKTKMVAVSDKVRIYRYGTEFDENKFATPEGHRNKKGEVLDYEAPTDGMLKRTKKWVEQNAKKLVKAGILVVENE